MVRKSNESLYPWEDREKFETEHVAKDDAKPKSYTNKKPSVNLSSENCLVIKPKDTCKQEREIDALANIVREEPKDLLTNLKLVEGPNASQPCENNRDKQGPQQIDATGNKVLGVFGKKKIRVVRGEEKLNCRIH